jgi:hypothetical protein
MRAQKSLQKAALAGSLEQYAAARTTLSDAFFEASAAHFDLAAHLRSYHLDAESADRH